MRAELVAALVGAVLGVLIAVVLKAVADSETRKRTVRELEFNCGEKLVVVVPHRERDDFVRYAVPQICTYVRTHHPCADLTVLCVEQTDRGWPYSKGLSWNVALAFLVNRGFSDNTQIVLNDADIVPRENVSYSCPPQGKGTLWFQNTGGLKVRLGDIVAAHGFPMAITGWGYEDVAMWRRLEKIAGVDLQHWKEEIDGKAVVLNLEWEVDMSEEEAEESREWYWGDDRTSVHMVGQGDHTWGLVAQGNNNGGRSISVPSKEGWYSDPKRVRNEFLGDSIEEIPLADYVALCAADGVQALAIQEGSNVFVVDFEQRFPDAAPLPPDTQALNLTFDSHAVLGCTPALFIQDKRFAWYFQGPEQCGGDDQTTPSCAEGQECRNEACLPMG